MTDFGFALVDAPQKDEFFAISFTDSKGKNVDLSFRKYIEVSGTTGFVNGDNFADQFSQTTAQELGLTNIQSVEIQLFASGGINNITWTEGGSVPEPSSPLLALAGLGLMARRRR